MAISCNEFITATGAEICGDRLIVGEGPARRFVGDMIGGKFNLTEDGEALMEQLEAGKKGPAAVKAAAAATEKKKLEAKERMKAGNQED